MSYADCSYVLFGVVGTFYWRGDNNEIAKGRGRERLEKGRKKQDDTKWVKEGRRPRKEGGVLWLGGATIRGLRGGDRDVGR